MVSPVEKIGFGVELRRLFIYVTLGMCAVGNALKFTNKGTVTVRVMLPITKDEPAATKSTTVVSFGGADLGLQEADNSAQLPGFSFQPVKQPPTSFAKLHSWSSWPGAYFKVQPENKEASIHDDSVDVWFGSSKVAPVTEIEKPEEESPSSNESTVSKKPVQIQFEVEDTGIGITKDKLQDMFNPFTQADPSASRLYGGTGLGLSIVQRYATLGGREKKE
jgi:signal transduction histidine kinase